MRWSKIKNIIILLLLIVNLFLLGMAGLRSWRSRESLRRTWEQTVTLLERRGLKYLPEGDPGELGLTPQQITLDTPTRQQAALLLGEDLTESVSGSAVTYTAGEAAAVCSPGTLSALLDPGRHPLNGADPGQAGLELLARLGYEAREVDRYAGEGEGSVTFDLAWQGVPVHGWTSTLSYAGGGLTALTVRPLNGTAQSLPAGGAPISAATALARFLEALTEEGYVCSQVTALYPGYAVTGVSGDRITLTPVWYIETDAQPSCFALDGYTGGVTAMG